MNLKLLFLLISTILLSSCYTHFGYVRTNEPVYDVYTYDAYPVYSWDYYDPFWRYDARISWHYDNYYFGYNYYFGLNYYPYRYYQLPYYNYFKPHHKFHRRPHNRRSVQINKRKIKSRHLLGHNVQQNVRVTKKRMKTKTYLDTKKCPDMSVSKYRHRISPRKTTKSIKRNVRRMSTSKKHLDTIRSPTRSKSTTKQTRSHSKKRRK